MKNLLLYLILLCFFQLTRGQTAFELKTLSDDYLEYDETYNNARFVFDFKGHTTHKYSNGTQPTYFYNTVLVTIKNLAQYTGDPIYIDEMFEVMTKIRNIATQNNSSNSSKFSGGAFYNDGFYDWPSDGVVADLWEQHGMRNIFEFLFWLKSYEADYFPLYEALYNDHFAWYKANLLDKWISRGYHTIFETNTWMTSHMAFISYFAAKLVTGSDKTTYENIYKAYLGDGITMTSIRASGNYDSSDGFGTHPFVDPNHGGYSWYGNWTETGSIGDINHQSAEVELMWFMYRDGYYYNSTDMDRLVTTVKAVLDAADAAGFPTYKEIPFRSDAIYRSSEDNRNFGFVPGWSVLLGHDDTLRAYFERMDMTTIRAAHYEGMFYSDRMLARGIIEGTVAKPLFGISNTLPDVTPLPSISVGNLQRVRTILNRR